MTTIRELRKRKGLSQSELAVKANLSHPVIVRAEKGLKPINNNSFLNICEALGVNPEEVTGVKLVRQPVTE